MVKISNNNLYILYFIIIILIIVILYIFYQNQTQSKSRTEYFIDNNSDNGIENVDIPVSIPVYNYINNTPFKTGGSVLNNSPKQMNSLDRIYNPLRYPYKSYEYYNQNWTPNLNLPAQVIGCGGRNTPCLGGTQVPIVNPTYPLDISNNNIAPINIRTRGPLGEPQQVGSLHKLYAHDNEVLPLYGRKKYPNGSYNWEYYTIVGHNNNIKLRVVTKRRGDEIGTNDVVFIEGYNKSPYRVTMYEYDFPQYVPYL